MMEILKVGCTTSSWQRSDASFKLDAYKQLANFLLARHWALTDSRPCASMKRLIRRLAHLAAARKRGAPYSSAGGAINAFQWSKIRLSETHPQELAAVQRFEADSKFFRSFTVVLLVLIMICAIVRNWASALVCAVLLLLSLWRYVNQRFKATQQAYWSILALENAIPARAKTAESLPREEGLTHAGGVVFRKQGKEETIEYLLVQASKDRSQWVLPKGHIESGEDPRETAVREVLEETGYWARVRRWIADVDLEHDWQVDKVRFYVEALFRSAYPVLRICKRGD